MTASGLLLDADRSGSTARYEAWRNRMPAGYRKSVLLAMPSQSHLSISSKGTSGTVVPNVVPTRFTASIIWSSDIAENCRGSDRNTDGDIGIPMVVILGSYPSSDDGGCRVSVVPVVLRASAAWLWQLGSTGARRISSRRDRPYRTEAPLR